MKPPGRKVKVKVEVVLPSLLYDFAGGQATVTVEAGTIRACLTALFDRYPLLQRHLFTEEGGQRKHVLFFHNDENTRWQGTLDLPVADGDTLTIVQAVSGG